MEIADLNRVVDLILTSLDQDELRCRCSCLSRSRGQRTVNNVALRYFLADSGR